MSAKTVVAKRACATCPFRRDSDLPVAPELLETTIKVNLDTGYAHRCHSTFGGRRELVCAGFTRFVTERGIHNRMLAMAAKLDIFNSETDLDRSTDFELTSWEAVVEMHRQRLVKEAT